jgi:hypothetical protein
VATPGHLFLIENHVCIVALTPDLQRVVFYSTTEALCYSSTTKFILLLIHIKGSYPSSETSLIYKKSSISLAAAVALTFMHDFYAGRYLAAPHRQHVLYKIQLAWL